MSKVRPAPQKKPSAEAEGRYPGVPPTLVGWTRYFMDWGGPALALLLALVAAVVALVSGDAASIGLTLIGAAGAGVGAVVMKGHGAARRRK